MEVNLSRRSGVEIRVAAPPSKSLTHRALVAAALADGVSEILRPLASEDTTLTSQGLRALGVTVEAKGDGLLVRGCGGRFPTRSPVTLDLKNSGTSLRLLAGVATLSAFPVTLTGSARMLERPVGPLGDAIAALGGEVGYTVRSGYPPITVRGPARGGAAVIRGDISSQFVSSLLMAAPCWEEGLDLTLIPPLVSAPYLDLTAAVMRSFGVSIRRDGEHFSVPPGVYGQRTYAVEGDWSSASYFFAIGAVCGGRVVVENLDPASLQGDRRFVEALEMMGASAGYGEDGIVLESNGDLDGIEVDMAAAPDTVQTLAAVAAFARGPTRITGIAHLRYKESDRIAAIERVLGSVGARVAVEEDAVTITPGPLHGATVDPENDHRTAMSAAVIGLGAGGVRVTGAGCVDKSFPQFWNVLQEAGLL
ncbi:3-phosphoshikimate 1-carboxyvinyltransferase [Methanofollis tationis]|uniref:3-phosphoshikimate 1-carboxyvinyltransferase n=1 Tax=Methanofollis tationis TaxID=81417 RepID=UPI001C40B26F|nr:3-phosphoshikimate 1-carboxyvinyltransferase [Methanofollis tationis]